MHYLGAKGIFFLEIMFVPLLIQLCIELYSFLTDKSLDNLFLQAFISKNEMLIISTSSQSSWEQLRNTWTRRYKELWKEARKNEKMKRCMVEVEEDMWKLLYSSTVNTGAFVMRSLLTSFLDFIECTEQFGLSFVSLVREEGKDLNYLAL